MASANPGAELVADEVTVSCDMCGLTVLGYIVRAPGTGTEWVSGTFYATSQPMIINRREPEGEPAATGH